MGSADLEDVIAAASMFGSRARPRWWRLTGTVWARSPSPRSSARPRMHLAPTGAVPTTCRRPRSTRRARSSAPMKPRGNERKLCGTAFAYSVAYSARCAHALGRDERRQPGTFQHLVSTHSRGLLDLQRYWGAEVSGHDEVRPSPDFEVPDQQTGGVRRRAPGSRRVSDPALGRALDERE